MTQEIIKKMEMAVKDPGQYAAEWAYKNKRKAVGVFPNFFPVQLLDAAGILPVGLWGSSVPITKADAHFQPFICTLLKTSFEMAGAGSLNELSGAVFPIICDSLQNSEGIWRTMRPDDFTTRYRISKNFDSKAAKAFLVSEHRRIEKEIKEHFNADFSELDIVESIIRRNALAKQARQLMSKFYAGQLALHPGDFFLAMKASLIMDWEEWIELTNGLMMLPGMMAFGGTKVIVSGMTAEPFWLFDILDDVDVSIAGDDIAFASRLYGTDVSEQGDPYESLADWLLGLGPCANIHHSDVHARGDLMVKKVKESGADGVIFTRLKFCDPESFDHPYLKQRLDEEGIPSLLLETEQNASDIGPVRTRIEAFAEQMEGDAS